MKRIILAYAMFFILTNQLFSPCHTTKAESANKEEIEQPASDRDYFDLGVYWAEKGDYDRAIASFSKATEINPRNADAYRNRGFVWKLKGDYEKALIDFTKAIEMDPQNLAIYNSIAWLLATCPDEKYRNGKRAIRWIQRVVELDPDNVISLDTLAAAYAEAGRFEDAIKTQQRVIFLLQKQRKSKELPHCIERLNFYKARKPWRE